MLHIPKSRFAAMPWRNGGGVTHEIAREGDGEDFVWRISIADVASSGPFSLFPRHERILCVIAGNGMRLASQHQTRAAVLLHPVAFSGSEVIDGRLLDGPCRDFNLIFDPRKAPGTMEVLSGPMTVGGSPIRQKRTGFYVVSGAASIGKTPLPAGDFCFLEKPSETLDLAADSVALKITVQLT
jgi:uncharacterized protein